MIQQKLIEAFEMNNGILTTELAMKFGVNDSTLRKAVERKDVKRYCRGVYFLDDVYFDDLYFLQLKYTKGVYSHETAVMLHTLSTYSPFVYHVSFPRGYHLANAKEQHIRPYYINERELMDEYVMVMDSWDSNPIKVTNLEKTVIDMLRHKSPMVGIVDEMIRDYVVRKDKNINKLIDYSYRFDVFKVVQERILPYVKSTKNEKLNKGEVEGI